MKDHKFTVTLTFSDHNPSVPEIETITDNVGRAIKSWADSAGIAPEDAEYYTKEIKVKHKLTGITYLHKF